MKSVFKSTCMNCSFLCRGRLLGCSVLHQFLVEKQLTWRKYVDICVQVVPVSHPQEGFVKVESE